jgi:glycosyltransferase involved in cell wall biosynthesis
MSLPLCTIVIPAYDASIWIERTLRSAAQQNYPNLEILVIDDGSKDNTRMLAEAMAEMDDRFRVISIPNGGVANARNVGIREACGKYVAFLDADDLWHPDKIRLQVEAMQHPADGRLPAASYTLMRTIDVHDRVTGTGIPIGVSGYILARHLYFKFVSNGSSFLVCRDVAIELGGYDPSWAKLGIGGSEDLDFELKVAARYPIVCVPQFLVGYRQSPANMSSHVLQMARGTLGVVKQHLESNPQIPRWATRLIYGPTLHWTFNLLTSGRHWRDALEHLGLMFVTQPHQAIGLVLWKLKNLAKRMLFLRRNAKDELVPRPLFAEISPKIDLAQSEVWLRRKKKILEALTTLDAELWLEMSQKQDEVAERPVGYKLTHFS